MSKSFTGHSAKGTVVTERILEAIKTHFRHIQDVSWNTFKHYLVPELCCISNSQSKARGGGSWRGLNDKEVWSFLAAEVGIVCFEHALHVPSNGVWELTSSKIRAVRLNLVLFFAKIGTFSHLRP